LRDIFKISIFHVTVKYRTRNRSCDVAGDYRLANAHEVLQAAQRVLAEQMRGCEALTSPEVVHDYLRVKLGALGHEVFAVMHLDSQNRVIEYVEMFRGSVSQKFFPNKSEFPL